MTAFSSSSIPSINVTPLIDVLLVLIIIFMVITPLTPRGFTTQVPQPPARRSAPEPDALTISLALDLSLRLNQELVSQAELPVRLQAWASLHASPVLFIEGDWGLEFHDVATVIDTARGAGLERIALLQAK